MEGRELRLQRFFLTQINQCQVCLLIIIKKNIKT